MLWELGYCLQTTDGGGQGGRATGELLAEEMLPRITAFIASTGTKAV